MERINIVVIRNLIQGQEGREMGMRRDPYLMEVNRGRNCDSCEEFGYLAWNFRNQRRIGQERKIEYEDNGNNSNNLKEKENLVVLD